MAVGYLVNREVSVCLCDCNYETAGARLNVKSVTLKGVTALLKTLNAIIKSIQRFCLPKL